MGSQNFGWLTITGYTRPEYTSVSLMSLYYAQDTHT